MTFDDAHKRLDAFTKILAIIGGVFTAWQYWEGKEAAKVERSLRFAEALNRGQYAVAREAISTELRNITSELANIRATPMPPAVAAQVHDLIIRGLIQRSRGGQGLGAELNTLVGLFDEVNICIEHNLCHAGTATDFLGEYGGSMWRNFGPWITAQRAVIPGYGTGMERFVDKMARRT